MTSGFPTEPGNKTDLVLNVKYGQAIYVGEIEVIVLKRDGVSRNRVLIRAPKDIRVERQPFESDKGFQR